MFKIDVYQIKYYKSVKGAEELRLKYKMDVKKKYSIMGWEKGLAHLDSSFKSQVQWILEHTQDFLKGDELIIRKNNGVVLLLKNDVVFAQVNDALLAQIIFDPWIGPSPVDNNLKNKLLNNHKE